jgi:PPK2 family polyphosphate:nucleotide phosphotransferase
MNEWRFIVPPGKRFRFEDHDPAFTGRFREKGEAEDKLRKDIATLSRLQDVLYAQNRYAVLLIFQAMDAAGKDGTVKHVMSGVNPQGCQVYSFKAPSAEELDHDFLWRCHKALPERGRIGIFNRSYYEEVLVVRVHPRILKSQNLPPRPSGDALWKRRFEDINHFERYLVNNGVIILKFFLHLSKAEQKRRFLERIDTPEKNWKFSGSDVAERAHWKDYMAAYGDVFTRTSTPWAPWHVIPADNKWFTRLTVADIIVRNLKKLDLHYPRPTDEHRASLLEARQLLEREPEPGKGP